MPLDSESHFFSSEKLLSVFADCLENAGTKKFHDRFLKLVDTVIEADQCMVFSFRARTPLCYLSYNVKSHKGGQSLASDYIDTGYKSDPLVKILRDPAGKNQVEVFRLADIKRQMRPTYFRKFFVRPGLVDKISLLARGHGEVLMINFYRFSERGEFPNSEPRLSGAFWSLVAQCVLLNYSLDKESVLKSPLSSLSKRESDVCRGILNGQTSESIAADLDIGTNSVATYRKRAYMKLGIHSKAALFALCRK